MKLIEQQLLEMGFIRNVAKPNVVLFFRYYLGRGRFLSASGLGTGNESVWLCSKEDENNEVIDDLICVHNYDYDGELTKEKMKYLIEYFEKGQFSWAFEGLKSAYKEAMGSIQEK